MCKPTPLQGLISCCKARTRSMLMGLARSSPIRFGREPANVQQRLTEFCPLIDLLPRAGPPDAHARLVAVLLVVLVLVRVVVVIAERPRKRPRQPGQRPGQRPGHRPRQPRWRRQTRGQAPETTPQAPPLLHLTDDALVALPGAPRALARARSRRPAPSLGVPGPFCACARPQVRQRLPAMGSGRAAGRAAAGRRQAGGQGAGGGPDKRAGGRAGGPGRAGARAAGVRGKWAGVSRSAANASAPWAAAGRRAGRRRGGRRAGGGRPCKQRAGGRPGRRAGGQTNGRAAGRANGRREASARQAAGGRAGHRLREQALLLPPRASHRPWPESVASASSPLKRRARARCKLWLRCDRPPSGSAIPRCRCVQQRSPHETQPQAVPRREGLCGGLASLAGGVHAGVDRRVAVARLAWVVPRGGSSGGSRRAPNGRRRLTTEDRHL